MIDPWTRTGRVAAYGVAWVVLLISATLGGLWAQGPSSVPRDSGDGAREARQLLQPAPPAPPTAPVQPPTVPPTQPPSPPTPPAPPAPPATPPTPPTPPPTITPPSPFVPQPGVPPQVLPPQKVAEILVQGNEKIPTEQVLNAISTKVSDPLNEEKLRNDVQAILNLGVFQDAVVRVEPVPEGARVIFVVVENPIVNTIDVKGNTVITTDDVLKALGVQTGAVLNTITMRAGVRAVEKLYQDKGYVIAHVGDVNVSPEGVLTLQLSEGRIEAVKIEGLHKTHDYVVRRELLFKPGDIFNVNDVNASLKRLFQLQYFSDVKAQPGAGSTPETVNVTVIVTEQKTASISFGVGYGNQTGLEGFVALKESNFGGNGQAVTLQYSNTALYGSSYSLSFREPRFLGSRTAMEVQLFSTLTIPTDYALGLNNPFQYNLTQVGGFLAFTSPLDPIDSFNYGFKSVTSTFGNPLIGTLPPAGFVFTPGQVNALILGVTRDTRNDPQAPISGERITLSSELSFQILGATFGFQKYEVDFEHFFPLGPASTILAHAHLGYSGTALPIQEQFYLGGQTTLRGYASGRFRGDEMALLQVEYRFPLSALPFMHSFSGVTTILFIDAGDVEPAGSTMFKLNPDVGLGIQLKTPFGPFRIDYGISGEGAQFWISSGLSF